MNEILKNFTHKVKYDYNLQNKHLFKKKTGNAKAYYQLIFDDALPNDLKVLHEMYKKNLPFKIFGLHTNLYITDNGYDGLFLDVDTKSSNITFNKETEEFTVTSNVVVSNFVNYTKEMGYDFAMLTGIPGVIGGGVVGNSSYPHAITNTYTKAFSDFVKKIIVYDFEIGDFIEIIPDETFFSTRNSFLKQANNPKTRYFVKEVILKADYIGKDEVQKNFDIQMNRRKPSLKISFEEGNAGSFFSTQHMQKLIGETQKSLLIKHPSININVNGATFSPNGSMHFTTSENTTDKDSADCLRHFTQTVKEIYGIDLHKEVMILDYDGEIDLQTFFDRNK